MTKLSLGVKWKILVKMIWTTLGYDFGWFFTGDLYLRDTFVPRCLGKSRFENNSNGSALGEMKKQVPRLLCNDDANCFSHWVDTEIGPWAARPVAPCGCEVPLCGNVHFAARATIGRVPSWRDQKLYFLGQDGQTPVPGIIISCETQSKINLVSIRVMFGWSC